MSCYKKSFTVLFQSFALECLLAHFVYISYFTAQVRRKVGNCCGFVPVSLPAGLYISYIIFLNLSRISLLVILYSWFVLFSVRC